MISVKKTFKRFLSITLIVMLGVGFFAGIRATGPDMKSTLDRYYSAHHMYDIELLSNYGITDKQIQEFLDKGYEIEGSYSFDAAIENQGEEYAVKVMSYDEDNTINQLDLLEGSYPSSASECVIERNQYTVDYQIGDVIYISSDELKESSLTIVGMVESPLYISSERGSTSILTGKINYYLYVPVSNFQSDVYTEAYIRIDSEDSYFSDSYEEEIEKEKDKIDEICDELQESRYQEVVLEYQSEIEKAEKEYSASLESYVTILNNPYVDYSTKAELQEKLDEAKKEIASAKEDLEQLEKVEFYILDLNSNIGFYEYGEDALRITNIAKVFPMVFFVVAILICLTSMTRMVEEQRGLIGTLKSLGYSDVSISFKYILYAVLATILGSVIGVLLGFQIIPRIIFNMYQMMYAIDGFVSEFYLDLMVLGTLIALVCTVGASAYACYKSLKETPAELLRPKAPRAGRRVWLEYVPFVWERLKFSNKVTVRNVFRYKKRMFMTIIGIAGCTGLILAGFGLKDCITNMVPKQYEDIFSYQVEVTLKDDVSLEEKNEARDKIVSLDGVTDVLVLEKESVSISGSDTNQSITLVVPFSDLSGFIQLRDRKSQENVELGSGVVITEKLTQLLDISVGDLLVLEANNEYSVVVGDVTENYLYHYIYMSKDVYDSDQYNTILLQTVDMSETSEKELSNQLKAIGAVSSLSFTSSSRSVFDSTMKNFAYVSMVLIVSAGLLDAIVLYNLASVNISEREREMATIKVLGFYDKEVYQYIGRESTILTFIGILLGMGVGKVLTGFIIKTCEIDMLMFDTTIHWSSYLYAIVITIFFTVLVDFVTYFTLKKIDMISSLKSVE